MANYDIIGNIAIIKFPENLKKEEKIKQAKELLERMPSLKTIVEKIDKVRGRLRTIKTHFLLGEKNLEALYKENNCIFKFNIENCYFSPRLARERLDIANIIKKNKKNARVLVMFAGVAPFSIVIAKHSNPKKVTSIELGKDCCSYARKNIILNKVENISEILQGDVKKIIPKLSKEKFDFIIMARPNLKNTFLKETLTLSKKGTKIIYYGFSSEDNKDKMLSQLLKESRKVKKKIKIQNVKVAGDIAPYEHRYRIEIIVD